MYQALVFARARAQVKKWGTNTNIIDKTKGVAEFMRNCPNRDAKIMYCKIKKDLVKISITAARQKTTALEKGQKKNRANTGADCTARVTNEDKKEKEEKEKEKEKERKTEHPPRPTSQESTSNSRHSRTTTTTTTTTLTKS